MSACLGIAGLTRDLTGESPFYSAEAPVVTAVMFPHMVVGGALTVLAPLQLAGPPRRRWPSYQRWGACNRLTGLDGSLVLPCQDDRDRPSIRRSNALAVHLAL